jgi:hypothetical protein
LEGFSHAAENYLGQFSMTSREFGMADKIFANGFSTLAEQAERESFQHREAKSTDGGQIFDGKWVSAKTRAWTEQHWPAAPTRPLNGNDTI